MSDHDHGPEPVPGLPEALPAGERILWQGAPHWQAMARHVFHLRGLALYFAAMLALRAIATVSDGGTLADALASAARLAPLAVAALALVTLIAWLSARATLYTITNRRVAMRIGIVLTVTFNLPLRTIESAALRPYRDGTGDIALTLGGRDRIAYLHLWPHARPWRYTRPEPMLRAVPDAASVAQLLVRATAAAPGAAVAPAVPAASDAATLTGSDTAPLAAAR
jgi:hypothetical protein